MKVGELVIYTEGVDPKSGEPREYNALVLGERIIADHTGEDGEPLLTLAFAKERTDAAGIPLPVHGTGQTSELVQIRLDVAHESHEYTEKQQRFYEKKQYDGGRWREAATQSGFESLRAKLSAREADLDTAWSNCHKAESDAIGEKARADVAETLVAELKPKADSFDQIQTKALAIHAAEIAAATPPAPSTPAAPADSPTPEPGV